MHKDYKEMSVAILLQPLNQPEALLFPMFSWESRLEKDLARVSSVHPSSVVVRIDYFPSAMSYNLLRSRDSSYDRKQYKVRFRVSSEPDLFVDSKVKAVDAEMAKAWIRWAYPDWIEIEPPELVVTPD